MATTVHGHWGHRETVPQSGWDETLLCSLPRSPPVPTAGNGCASLQMCVVVVGSCLLSSWSSGNLSSLFYRKLHSGMKTYGCELCGKRFLDSLRLRMHLLAHSGKQGLLPWPHVDTDNYLLPIFPLSSELATV